MYVKPSRARILGLKDSLTCATKGTLSIYAYLQHSKQLVTTLISSGAVITLDDVTLYVFNGLSSKYKDCQTGLALVSGKPKNGLYELTKNLSTSLKKTINLVALHTRIIIYLIVYVDDLIVIGNSDSTISLFLTKLGTQFSIKDLGNLTYFLGVQFIRTSNEREDIVDHASMAGAKSSLTPLATTNSLMLDDSAHLPNPKEYQFAHHPTTNHWIALKHVIRYLIGTTDHGLFLHKNSFLIYMPFLMQIVQEITMIGHPLVIMLFFLNKISRSANKKHYVARSSSEAKYRFVATTTAKIVLPSKSIPKTSTQLCSASCHLL
uniref:Reverse transcriptase Ty1/copia-type domain-containing protein n=1 Tax=Solanum lycopersicum TaxID=4081 RepID=A0A3Q7GHI6_SOLLC